MITNFTSRVWESSLMILWWSLADSRTLGVNNKH